MQESAAQVVSGEKSYAFRHHHSCIDVALLTCSRLYRQKDHADYESLERNRISNVSFAVCSAGEIVVLAIMVGILKGLKSDESTENNTKAFSVLIAFSGGVWGE